MTSPDTTDEYLGPVKEAPEPGALSVKLTEREAATILAALEARQAQLIGLSLNRSIIDQIATRNGDLLALDACEIDCLRNSLQNGNASQCGPTMRTRVLVYLDEGLVRWTASNNPSVRIAAIWRFEYRI